MKTRILSIGGIIAFYLFIALSVMSINSRLETIKNQNDSSENINVAYNH